MWTILDSLLLDCTRRVGVSDRRALFLVTRPSFVAGICNLQCGNGQLCDIHPSLGDIGLQLNSGALLDQ